MPSDPSLSAFDKEPAVIEGGRVEHLWGMLDVRVLRSFLLICQLPREDPSILLSGKLTSG